MATLVHGAWGGDWELTPVARMLRARGHEVAAMPPTSGAIRIAPVAARARAAGWIYRELALPHDPHVFDPDGVAAVLDELAMLC